MKRKLIVRIFLILTSFIIMLIIPNSNFYIKNVSIYLFLFILLISVLRPSKYLKIKKIRKNLYNYFLGILIGTLLSMCIIIILLLMNKIELVKNKFSITVIIFIGIFWVIQSFFEEYLIRGILYEYIGNLLGYDLTIIITSLFFAIFHINNSNISLLSLINIFLFGILCGILLKIYKNIFLVSGLHFIWNFLQGNFWGIKVSGITANDSFFTTILIPNQELYHGGNFGIEGGIITFLIIIFFIIFLIILSFNKYQNSIKKVNIIYHLYKSIDGFYLISKECIEKIKLNDETYTVAELNMSDCLKNTSLKLLVDLINEKNDNIIFDLQKIEITYFDKLALIAILNKKEGKYRFLNSKYLVLKSLEFSLD